MNGRCNKYGAVHKVSKELTPLGDRTACGQWITIDTDEEVTCKTCIAGGWYHTTQAKK